MWKQINAIYQSREHPHKPESKQAHKPLKEV